MSFMRVGVRRRLGIVCIPGLKIGSLDLLEDISIVALVGGSISAAACAFVLVYKKVYHL